MRGELEAAAFLRDSWHVPCQRGQQHRGGPDSPDLRHVLEGVHLEVSREETACLTSRGEAKMAQAEADAGVKIPLYLHRKNHGPWRLVLDAAYFPLLARAYMKFCGWGPLERAVPSTRESTEKPQIAS
jgi:hypothetical protein